MSQTVRMVGALDGSNEGDGGGREDGELKGGGGGSWGPETQPSVGGRWEGVCWVVREKGACKGRFALRRVGGSPDQMDEGEGKGKKNARNGGT